jgi:hypothetical protein
MEKHINVLFTDDRSKISNEGTGDYKVLPNGDINIISYCKDEEFYIYAWLCFIHEAIEQQLTSHNGIPEYTIDAYDKFIVEKGGEADEAGNERFCPYYFEHHIAESIERMLAAYMGVNWEDYENYIP